MGNWNDIPFELKRLILLDLNNNKSSLYNCLLVNRQWLLICQPMLYKNISLAMEFEDKIFDTIQHSKSQPGKWVEKVDMKSLSVPTTWDPSQALYTFMRLCPHVQQVNFLTGEQNLTWSYFYAASAETGIWKLQSLPNKIPYFGSDGYMKVAQLMQDTLTHLILFSRSQVNGFGFLKDFTSLVSLDIGEEMVHNMSQCINVIKYTPLVESLRVDFYSEEMEQVTAGDRQKYTVRNTRPSFPAIKKLYCQNYSPFTDRELLFLVGNFTGVADISIESGLRDYWRTKDFSLSAITSFFEYIVQIPKYSLVIRVNDECVILKSFLAVQSDTKAIVKKLGLSINFYNTPWSFRPLITINNAEATLNYGMKQGGDVGAKLEETLADIGESVSDVMLFQKDVTPDSDRSDTDVYFQLGLVLDACPNLNELAIHAGHLDTPSSETPLSKIRKPIKDAMMIKKTTIHPGALEYVSTALHHIENLCFEGCHFVQEEGIDTKEELIDICMPDTVFSAIMISYKAVDKHGTIYLSIDFKATNSTVFYINREGENKGFQMVDQEKFKSLKNNQQEKIIHIRVVASSIQEIFIFKSRNRVLHVNSNLF